MHQYILYQAYGTLGHINECRYSLLKFLEFYNLTPPAKIEMVIYTDQPSLFEAFSAFFHHFEIKEFSEEQLKQWRGANNFIHRAKIEILRSFFQDREGNLLYFDTDTYITKPVEPIFAELAKGNFYLHEFEGRLNKNENPAFHKWIKFLSSQQIDYNKGQVVFSESLKMWNAGVIGIPGENKDILKDILSLTDSVYSKFKKHIAEQFAFSYCFQKSGNVTSSKNEIVHYWNLKEFSLLLKVFFANNEEESIPNLVKLLPHLDPASIQEKKLAYQKLPFFKKWLYVVKGKKWTIKTFENKITKGI
ncbi:MAG: hypothetical protein NVS9B7_08970 [Flavisolibacter sp.]